MAEGHVEGALAAASQVLSELTTIVTEVAPCAPPAYQVVPLAKNLYHSFLLGPLEALYSQPSALDVDPLLKLVEWLDYYNAEMCARVSMCTRVENALSEEHPPLFFLNSARKSCHRCVYLNSTVFDS